MRTIVGRNDDRKKWIFDIILFLNSNEQQRLILSTQIILK